MIVRGDLPFKHQAVQAGHAAIQFQHQHKSLAEEWHDKSNHLVYLEAKDESDLAMYIHKLSDLKIAHSVFIEPDFGHQITAVAIEPCEKARKLLSNLPLAFKNIKEK